MQLRAYSTLEIKAAVADGKRIFRGIASTPSVDMSGDVVDPQGAEFKLPLPFLWQHDMKDPIGWITEAKASKSGISIVGEVAQVENEGALKSRLAMAWDMISAGLVRGLSVGFMSKESERMPTGIGRFHKKWSWHELSAVTMPMNTECSILTVKSADEALRLAASAARSQRPVIRFDIPSGVPERREGVLYL